MMITTWSKEDFKEDLQDKKINSIKRELDDESVIKGEFKKNKMI